jgi:hypothetical protein
MICRAKQTLDDWLFWYLRYHPGLSPGYEEQLRCLVAGVDRWAGHQVDLDALSDDLAIDYLAWLAQHGRKPPTVNTHRHRLLTLWRSAASAAVAAPPGVIPLPVPEF